MSNLYTHICTCNFHFIYFLISLEYQVMFLTQGEYAQSYMNDIQFSYIVISKCAGFVLCEWQLTPAVRFVILLYHSVIHAQMTFC